MHIWIYENWGKMEQFFAKNITFYEFNEERNFLYYNLFLFCYIEEGFLKDNSQNL